MKIGPDTLHTQLDALRQGQADWSARQQESNQPDPQEGLGVAEIETDAPVEEPKDPANELLLTNLWEQGQAQYQSVGAVPQIQGSDLSGWANRLADFILA